MLKTGYGKLLRKKIIKATPFGPVVIVWAATSQNVKVRRVFLSKPGLSAERLTAQWYPDARVGSCPGIDKVAAGIKHLLNGKPVNFSIDLLDFNSCSEFQKRVLKADHRIPRSKVSTYQLIGTGLGKPQGARAVGNTLANNPFPLVIPCHRVVRSDNRLGGYQGGLAMKRALLKAEGVIFDRTGKVAGSCFYNN